MIMEVNVEHVEVGSYEKESPKYSVYYRGMQGVNDPSNAITSRPILYLK